MRRLTIHRGNHDQFQQSSTLALQALGWVLTDDRRAQRLLDLTGLTPDSLRAALGETATHRAVLEYLCSYEPDLVAAAEALGCDPARLVAAHAELTQ